METNRTKRKNRQWNLKSKYGITIEEYNEMFQDQCGCCAICNIHQSELKETLYVDHNHLTGEIRGLLCSKCNFVLGLMNDDPTLLGRASEYLYDNTDKMESTWSGHTRNVS